MLAYGPAGKCQPMVLSSRLSTYHHAHQPAFILQLSLYEESAGHGGRGLQIAFVVLQRPSRLVCPEQAGCSALALSNNVWL